jgi:hypothetical protein
MKVENYKPQPLEGWSLMTIESIVDSTDDVNTAIDKNNKERGQDKDHFNCSLDITFVGDRNERVNTRYMGRYGSYDGRATSGSMRIFPAMAEACGISVIDGEFDEYEMEGKQVYVRVYKNDRDFFKVFNKFMPHNSSVEHLEYAENEFQDQVSKGFVRVKEQNVTVTRDVHYE